MSEKNDKKDYNLKKKERLLQWVAFKLQMKV